MKRWVAILASSALLALALAVTPGAQAAPCEPKASCFGFEAAGAAISTHQAGAHPDLTLSFALAQDPSSPPNKVGMFEPYANLRDITIETPPGVVGEPNVLGVPQQCTVQELVNWRTEGCPNGSQVGISQVVLYGLFELTEPIYMMAPPGGDVIARLGLIGGVFPTFIDLTVRSEDQSDFGLSAHIEDVSPNSNLLAVTSTLWGVPAAEEHDTERCTPEEAFNFGCTTSEPRPPGSRPLSFMTNPTSCGPSQQATFTMDSWAEPGRFLTESVSLPPITGCDKLPFKPSLSLEPTSRRAAAPTGLELSYRLPAPEGVGVLESSQLRDLRIDFPAGIGINTASADGLGTCSAEQVGFGTAEPSNCPDSAKLGETEFDIPALPRRMKGAIYLREPEPGHLFRVWVVADDLGAHVKLPGELEVNEETGQISSVVLGLPQVPVREVRLLLKSGFRAPLVNPSACGTYQTHWEFTPWSGTEAIGGDTPMTIDEGCQTGGFDPQFSAGSTNPAPGAHAPFLFAISREDGEQNTESIDVSLPRGIAASFAGIPRCEGAEAVSGNCPPASLLGRVIASSGAGPAPLWVPQEGKDPTAVYLAGPYKGAPLSVIAVVPAQAGPFDLGDIVVRSAIYIDPTTAQATAVSDPIPQIIQGVPIPARTIEVLLDRPDFTLNPTSCAPKQTTSLLSSAAGATAAPSAYFQASGCANLPFKPKLHLALLGAHRRASNPRLVAKLRAKPGEANIARAQVTLPSAAFLDNSHIQTICTRVQFAADTCPAGSIYGRAEARTPLFDFPLSGAVYLRSSDHPLPDLVVKLKGPAQMPIEIDLVGRTDSVNGALRNTFEAIPDAPVSSFQLELFGGKRGLVELSRDLCAKTYRSTVKLTGQNGKHHDSHPAVGTSCKAKKHRKAHKKSAVHR